MECSICFDDMCGALGTATMTCGHQFHLGCVARWLLKTESCPLCRREATDKEKIADDQSEDSCSEDDEESVISDEEGNWVRMGDGRWILSTTLGSLNIPEYDHDKHAFWVMRRTFELAEAGESISPAADPVAASASTVSIPNSFKRTEWRHEPGLQTVQWRHMETDSDLADERGYESA